MPRLVTNFNACRLCRQSFATSQTYLAGHNKWSKTKHIKAVTDKKKMAERTAFTKLIAMYSRSESRPRGDFFPFCSCPFELLSSFSKDSVLPQV